jgi:peptidyl-prolyl cis-trans isomerase SurA
MMLARIVLLAFAVLFAAGPSRAQDLQRIAAIVNDDIISMFDLTSRVDLVIATSGLPDSPEVRARIQPQVLRGLIDERLQLQEAKKRSIAVTKTEMNNAVHVIERENHLPSGGLEKYVEGAGIRPETLMEQIRANLAWQKLISRQYRQTATVTTEQVDEELAKVNAARGKEEDRVAEILLNVNSPDEDRIVRENAQRLAEQIRKGARFDALARQFSRGATAAVGGDLGWIRPPELDPPIAAAIARLKPGEVSEPVRTIAGYHILKLVERRRAMSPDPSKVKLTLDQLFLPSQGDGKAAADLARAIGQTVEGCGDVERVAKEARSPRPPHLGQFTLGELSAEMRELVQPLKVGELSKPLATDGGLLMVMVCKRDEPKVGMPSREQIENGLMLQRLNMMARRHLRDLHLAAVIDVRV